jgi:hypothetical protein
MRIQTISVAVTLALAGCATVSTNSATAPGADLAQYKTYDFYPASQGRPDTVAAQETRAALERNLSARGLTLVQPGQQPDFLVAFQGKQQQKVNVYSGGYWGYYGYYGYGGFPSVTTYTEGTLIVDFIDARTQKAFWRGTASAVIDNPNNPSPAKINKAVAKLVQQYPVQVAAVPRQAM